MINVMWVSKKNELISLVKKVSEQNGGDDEKWLKIYCEELVQKYRAELQKAINCFLSLEK